MTHSEIAILFAAALLAGVMNAVAGGGTIITFPALLAFGMPAIQANATSTFALLVGIAGSFYGYRSHLPAAAPWLKRFAIPSVAGGLAGAWLLTVTPEEIFSRMVPFLLLFATLLFMAQGPVKRWLGTGNTGTSPHLLIASIAGQFLVAVYGGYFGAGIGILMLAAFGLMGLSRIHEMNALKTILAAGINIVATLYFILAGLIQWPQAWVMTAGAALGYFTGAHYAQRIPEKAVRHLVTLIGLGITAILFYRQFF